MIFYSPAKILNTSAPVHLISAMPQEKNTVLQEIITALQEKHAMVQVIIAGLQLKPATLQVIITGLQLKPATLQETSA